MRQFPRVLRAALLLGGAAGALTLAAPRPPLSATAAIGWCTAGDADLALARAATVGAWLCLAWIAAVLLVTVATACPGAAGRAAGLVARVVAPAAMRHAMEAVIGVTVATLPVVGLSSAAWADDGPPPAPTWSPPSLDRPAGPAPAVASPRPAARYVVRPGECLWTIAQGHLPPGASTTAVARSWPEWYAANRRVIGANPNLIRPGQRLTEPAPPPASP